jgi:hypothetical protein
MSRDQELLFESLGTYRVDEVRANTRQRLAPSVGCCTASQQ